MTTSSKKKKGNKKEIITNETIQLIPQQHPQIIRLVEKPKLNDTLLTADVRYFI
jgi:hypothetical protein